MPEFRSRPEQYPVIGALGRYLKKADDFARAPGGYENPPVAIISDLLNIPPIYRTLENINYGTPVTQGRGETYGFTADTKDALTGALDIAPIVPAAARMVKPLAKAAAPYAARHAVNLAEKYGVSPTMNVIKPKGGNWLNHTVGDAVEPLKRHLTFTPPSEVPNTDAVNKWVDSKLAKYITNEMATPEDPIRALAEKDILHFQPRYVGLYSNLMDTRMRGGFPREGMANSPLAIDWEKFADSAINRSTAGEQLNFRGNAENMPWLTKVPPETPVYSPKHNVMASENLGFPHLIDELKNATSAASDLPANLRIDLKSLDKLTVPQAVERVAKINAFRAKQAAEAEREGMMANLQEKPRLADEDLNLSFTEKPGGTWVDIPETTDAKGMKLCSSIGKAGGWCTQSEWAAKDYGSGINRLTALLDAEGRPHVQVKITQDVDEVVAIEDATMYMTPEQEIAYDRHFSKLDRPPEFGESLDWMEENAPDAYKVYEEIINSQPKLPPSITELKPPGNSFSSDRAQEYSKRDPYYGSKLTQSVLKFLNSGEWGKVNDLHHYGIVDLEKDPVMLTQYLRRITNASDAEAQTIFNAAVDANPNAPRFMTTIQLRDFIEGSMKPEGFAQGGSVNFAAGGYAEYDDDLIRQMAAELVDAQQERAEESRDIPELSLLDSLRNMSPLGGRVSAGPFDLDAMTHSGGVNLRGSVGTDNLRGYVDVDPRQKKLSQLGVTYEDMNPRGGYHLNASMDPETREKTLNALYRKQLSDGSELMVGGTHRPDSRQTMLNLMYRYGFAQGGEVQARTRAGTPAKPTFLDDQIERTEARLKGLVTDPDQELRNIARQYFPSEDDTPEERYRKMEDLALGFAGTTGKIPNKGGAKLSVPEIDLSRRKLFGLSTEPKPANLPVEQPNIIKNVLETPVTRRQVLRSGLANTLKSFMPEGLSNPLTRLASEETAKETAKEAVKSTAPSLMSELKASIYNMPRRSLDHNWGMNTLLDRGYITKNLLNYSGESLLNKMSLKEALRQIKSDPKVYKKFKKTLNDLNNEERVPLIQYSKNKEDYLKLLSEDGYSKNIIARESRLWDQNDGKFKRARLPSEESSYPMYDPHHSPSNLEEGFEKGGKVKRKEPSPFDDLEPTFGDRMGAWVSDKVTEGGINLYDKLSNRDRMSAAHKIYLDTFARDKRDPITAKDFNTEELAELQNLIRQKEKMLGGKGKGYIEYKDYTELTGGDRRKGITANLIGGVMPPRPSLAKSLGQFNYELDPTTKQYKIIDEYDFNPQQIEYQGRKVDVPVEHYGDYLGEGSLYALARLYGGRKMPPGTGRKVELSVPYAKGGAVEFNPDEIDMMAAQLIEEQNG